MIGGKTSPAFSGTSLPPEPTDENSRMKHKIEILNQLAYGSPKLLVEEKVRRQLA
jgi:hypothetical protein